MDAQTGITTIATAGKIPQLPEPDQPEEHWAREAWEFLQNLRSRTPLIQCITNVVSMDLMSNVLLAVGASPPMLSSINEIPDCTRAVDALYINIETLFEDGLTSMRATATVASQAERPWVLDLASISESNLRMKACLFLLEFHPAVIKGNASEIQELGKAVDNPYKSFDIVEAAKCVSRYCGAIVAVSDAVDYITDGEMVLAVKNDVPMLQKIPATGCAATALIAAFISVSDYPPRTIEATVCALSIFRVAAELGMERATGPASLRMHLIDYLFGLNESVLASRVKVFRLPE